jgi:hypothetical protein
MGQHGEEEILRIDEASVMVEAAMCEFLSGHVDQVYAVGVLVAQGGLQCRDAAIRGDVERVGVQRFRD